MKPRRILTTSAALLILTSVAQAQLVYFTNGVVRHQMWSSANPNGLSSPSRTQVENNAAGNPTYDDFSSSFTNSDILDRTAAPTTADFNLTVFDTPEEEGDNYVDRVSCLFIPATSGNYVFFLSSDDDSDLFLSTDATPANKRLIAQEASWSNMDQWSTPGGGASLASQKRSDQWTNGAGVAIYSNGFPLVAGQKYWLEAVHHEGGGGDQVGATFKVVGNPDPKSGDPSLLTGSVIGYGLTFTSPLVVTAQPTNTTGAVGGQGSFSFGVKNPSNDPLVNNALVFQWYRNNNAVANATAPSYTFVPTAADNGAQFYCIASLDPIYNLSLSVTSTVATLTVNTTTVTYTNGLKSQMYLGASRAAVEAGNTGPASSTSVAFGFELPVNDNINNYARRVSGWFIPPTTGNYTFFLCSDDDSDLFLSTDNTAASKQLIAQENVWSNSREWISSGGNSITNQKHSDTFTNLDGNTPYSNGIPLTAGTLYYIEADHHQAGGGDNLAVTYIMAGSAYPTNGAPPIPGNELALITTPTTTLSITNPPRSVTVFEGDTALFTVGATTDSEFLPLYQWQREGTNIPGATATSYGFVTTAADNGAHFDVVVSSAEGGLSQTSAVVTATVQKAILQTGLVKMEYWINQGADLTALDNNLLGTPNFVMAVPAFEAGVNNENGDSYQNRVSGFFIPATTGNYDFIVTGDDNSDLFLSTDSNPNNKRMIAQQPGWSNALTWGTDNGSARGLQQKHSATWTNANSGNVAPFANGIPLTAGQKYYMEANHQEGTGGDSVAVYVKPHGDPDPGDGTDSDLTGALIAFNAQAASYVAFTNQPTNATVISATSATFSAGGISDANIPVGTTGQFQTSTTPGATNFINFPTVLFQWYKNNTLIPGATSPTYTTPPTLPSDNGAQFVCGISAIGISGYSNSQPATLTVITDTNKPTFEFSGSVQINFQPYVSLTFSKRMDPATLTNLANYNITGATIAGIVIYSNDYTRVDLQLVVPPTLPATITLTGITDWSGNPLVNTTLPVINAQLVNQDIGAGGVTDPAFPGYMWLDDTNAYTIMCEGSDIWNADDGFNFSYEQKTNDFDVVVRQTVYTPTSQYAKGGLMARDTLDSNSRNFNIVNDPAAVPTVDGATGNNTTETNWRTNTASNSAGWGTGPSTKPAYPNAWLRLKRTGTVIEAFWSTNNAATWVRQAGMDPSTNAATTPLPSSMYVGICCTAHNNDDPASTNPRFYYTGSFADYNSSYVYVAPILGPMLTGTLSGGNISISWAPAGGHIESTAALGAGAIWTSNGVANPYITPATGPAKFFRVVVP